MNEYRKAIEALPRPWMGNAGLGQIWTCPLCGERYALVVSADAESHRMLYHPTPEELAQDTNTEF